MKPYVEMSGDMLTDYGKDLLKGVNLNISNIKKHEIDFTEFL